jgi:uncharacterized FlaG/YvyC family protein
MVDLGISRSQDIQYPLAANTPATRIQPPAGQDQGRPQQPKVSKSPPATESAPAPKEAVDLEAEVRRLNDLMGAATQIRFRINRTTNDIYVEVVDKNSNQVLKTIPPSNLNDVAGKLIEGGILVDNRS